MKKNLLISLLITSMGQAFDIQDPQPPTMNRNERLDGLLWEAILDHSPREDVIDYMVEQGANINSIVYIDELRSDVTPLLYAAQIKNNQLADFILKHNPDLEEMNDAGETALFVATRTDNIELVQKLLSCGANINTQQMDGFTPLIAAVSNELVDMTNLLLENGANTTKKKQVETYCCTLCMLKKQLRATTSSYILLSIRKAI